MRLSMRRWLLIVASVIAVASTVSVLVLKFVDQRHELELSSDFLHQHTEMFPQLGNVESITFRSRAASRVSFKSEKIEGFYSFRALGEAGACDVRVFWENSKHGDAFTVLRVEQVNRGETPTVLWPILK